MRRPLLAVLLAPLLLARCECDTDDTRAAVGKVIVEPLEIDFEVVCVGDTVIGEVTVKNEGLGDLRIDKVTVAQSAGGYTVGVPPGSLAPNGVVKIPVTLTVTDTSADYNASVVIETDDPENPKRTVNLAARAFGGKRRQIEVRCPTIANPLVDGPCTILDFGASPVRNGTSAERTARIRNMGCAPMEVFEVKIEADTDNGGELAHEAWFEVLGPQPQPVTLGGQSEVEMKVRFSPPLSTDFLTPNVRFHVRSDDPDKADWDGGVRAFGNSPLIFVDPLILTFFGAELSSEKVITVTNAGGVNANVTVSMKPGSASEWILTHDAGEFASLTPGDHQIRVQLGVPGGWQGSAEGVVLIDTPEEEPVEVKLFGGAFPEAQVTPNPVGCWSADNGTTCATDVPVGAGRSCCTATPARTAVVRITNVGHATLRIDSVSDTDDNLGDSFSVSATGLPWEIAPTAMRELTVTFRDNPMITDDPATLVIGTNDPQFAGAPMKVSMITRNNANFPPTPQLTVSPNSQASWVVGATLTFDAAQTNDQENDAITYAWALTAPAGSSAALQGSGNLIRTLVPDVAGLYRVSLIATDRFDPRPGAPARPYLLSVNVR